MVWNHYENRRGLPAPYTKQAAEKIRPEGASLGGGSSRFRHTPVHTACQKPLRLVEGLALVAKVLEALLLGLLRRRPDGTRR